MASRHAVEETVDWRELERLFDEAADLPPEERRAWVDGRTEGEAEARDKLRALLDALEGESPLDAGAGSAAPGLLSVIESRDLAADSLDSQVLGPYRIDGRIGQGGMAEVYEARRADGSFERSVAIKVLRQGLADHEARARFARERQILASLSHPHVARLYDGGQTDGGRPYFVLEKIDGVPITAYCRERSLARPERLRLFLAVLEGVEHAHRRGILHRDLKPSNLLVEERDGAPRPVVLDFGIAHIASEPGLTLTGQALGTPAYMAPEQARGVGTGGTTPPEGGEAMGGDPRADIFSLGAVLFELVVDRPLYDAGSSAQLLAQALEARIDWSDLPPIERDLETILRVALAPDPRDRYGTVAQLASDLAAFLADAPISVRRLGPIERAVRLARRSPRLTAGLAVVAVALLALVGLNLRERWRAEAAARDARLLGQEIAAVDSMLRLSHLLPVHDVRPDRQRVEGALAGFEALLDDVGGPAHYAIGRGALGLRQLDRARHHLEAAWSAVPATASDRPAIALTLGRTYAALYAQEAEAARKIRDAEERQTTLEGLDAELRRPAIERLDEGRDAAALAGAGSPTFVEALLAFQRERFDEAARLARRAAEDLPWLYEAVALEARSIESQGAVAAAAGEHEVAGEEYARAVGIYDRALTIGRSDPALYFERCRALNRTLDLARETGDLEPALFDRVAALCTEGLVADPDAFDLVWSIARIHWQRGVHLRVRGEDAEPAWRDVITLADRALEIEPTTYQATNLKGLAWMYRGATASDEADFSSARHALDAAVAAFERTLEIDRNHRHAGNNLGLVHYHLALIAERTGEDPRPVARIGVGHLEAAAERDPTYAFAPNNASVIWRVIAEADQRAGEDPEPARAAGIAAARAALAINPRYGNALENQANLLLDRVRDRVEAEPRAVEARLAEAIGLLDQALEISENTASFWRTRAEAYRLRAVLARVSDTDPRPWWGRAEADRDEAAALNPASDPLKKLTVRLLLDRAEGEPGRRAGHLRSADRILTALEAGGANDLDLAALRSRRARFDG